MPWVHANKVRKTGQDERTDVSRPSAVQLRSLDYAAAVEALSPESGGLAQVQRNEVSGDKKKPKDKSGHFTEADEFADFYQGGKAGTLFSGPPRATDVQQGGISDCWLVGSIAALADANPGYIQNTMMQQEGPNVKVRLFWATKRRDAPSPETITVALSQLPSYLDTDEAGNEVTKPYYGHASRKSKDGKNLLWVSALEMAVAVLFSKHKHKGEDAEGFEHIDWGSRERGMMVLLGAWPHGVSDTDTEDDSVTLKSPDGGTSEKSPPRLACYVREAKRAGKPITAVTSSHVNPVLSVKGGPSLQELAAAAIGSPVARASAAVKNKNSLQSFEIEAFDQNYSPEEGKTTYTGWADIMAHFVKGFVVGKKPPGKGR